MLTLQEDIKIVLTNLVQNPNSQNISEFIYFLETQPIDIWENCLDNHLINRSQTNPSSDAIIYRALFAVLVPSTVVEWLLWLKSLSNKRKIQESLAFQEEIWDASQQRKKAYNNFRTLIDAGISELLCELTTSYVSEKDYENITWLLVKEKKRNIWYTRFRDYTNIFLHEIPKIASDKQQISPDYFHLQVAGTLSYLQQLEWQKTRSEYENLAKLFEKSKNYELSAIFYQISTGSVPSSVFSQMTQIDLYKIPDNIPLSRKRSSGDRIWRILRHLLFVKYILLLVLVIIFFFVVGFLAFHFIFSVW
jgi:hypothetical protein